jgi:hypothetical protein
LEPDFFITFYGEPDAENRLMREGVIRIGGFSEAFEASLVYWTEDDYLQQWQQALARLFAGYEHTCLISSIDDPKQARFLIWWPIYRVGDRVYIQNHLLFFDQLAGGFNEADIYRHVGPRETLDERGNEVSEWSVSLQSVRVFYDALVRFNGGDTS